MVIGESDGFGWDVISKEEEFGENVIHNRLVCEISAVFYSIDFLVRLYFNPRGGYDVGFVSVGGPLLWGYDNLVGIGIEPRSPPAEGAVGDDVVMATAHQVHVLPAFAAMIPIHIDSILKRQVAAAPANVIGEDIGYAGTHSLLNIL